MAENGGPEVRFRVLGPFEVVAGAQPVDVGTGKARLLVAMLAVARGGPVGVDALADEIWGPRPQVDVALGLQSLVSRARRALTPYGVGVTMRGHGYALDLPRDAVDAGLFEAAIAKAREHAAAGAWRPAAEGFRAALALWRGPALADLADRRFAQVEAARLDEIRLAVTEELASALLGCGAAAEAVSVLEALVAAAPYREGACGQLMRALYRCGRQADALGVFQRLRRALRDEMGLEPGPALRELEAQILTHSKELQEPGPPDDIRAFLFTDIEASTRRWEGDRDAMGADLARHDALLRAAVEEHGGRVMSHTGDGLCAEFSTVTAALETAVAGQLALRDQSWQGRAALRVRMAVHAGAAQARDGGYFGPTLNRTARLMALAAGGQVLCSQAAADLAWDRLAAGMELLDLGEHELADLTRPERVFQLGHAELARTFPPLSSGSAPAHNLPQSLSRFLGREDELDELESLLAGERLVTLWGPGGVGKTRLSLELGARSCGHFRDGVWFVELAAVSAPDDVGPAVMSALGMLSDGRGGVREKLCRYLSRRQLLIVLDNCEHVLDGAARLAHAVLAGCPDVRVVASSREPLGVPGEFVWPARSLAETDAVALFCERVRASHPGFALTGANASSVGEICRRLDGIPLALELAAARVRVLGVGGVADRLDDRFRLLTGGPRTSDPRHQTMRAAVDWSYELLPAAERRLLAHVSMFPASFDLAAAEAVVGGDAPDTLDVLDVLGRLVDRSLVHVTYDGDSARYRMLEIIRQYAAELLDAEEVAAARRRHLAHFRSRLPSLRTGIDQQAFMATYHSDAANFRAALELAITEEDGAAAVRFVAALWTYWMWSASPLDTPQEWTEQALGLSVEGEEQDRVHATIGLAWSTGSPAFARSALARARTLDDDLLLAWATILTAAVVGPMGHPDEADTLCREGLRLSTGGGYGVVAAWCRYGLAWTALTVDHPAEARDHMRHFLADAAATEPNPFLEIHARSTLAVAAAVLGDLDEAAAAADIATALARTLQMRGVLIMATIRGATVAVLTGRWAQAARTLRECLTLVRQSGTERWAADALELSAFVLHTAGGRDALPALVATAADLRERVGGMTCSGLPGLRAAYDVLRTDLDAKAPLRLDDALSLARDELGGAL